MKSYKPGDLFDGNGRSRLGELLRARRIAADCQVGQPGYLATRILLQAGVSALNIGGGYATYKLFHPRAVTDIPGNREGDETKVEIQAIPAALSALT